MKKILRGLLFSLFYFLSICAFIGCTPGVTDASVQEPTPTPEACQFLPPAEPDHTPTHDPPTYSVKLIGAAWDAGEITNGERLVYLAYWLVEPSSLPAKFVGTRLVSGTSVAMELTEAVQDPDVMCQLSSCEQEELKRLLDHGVDCG